RRTTHRGQGCAAGGPQPPPADGVGGNGRGLPWLPPSIAHVSPHLSRELLKKKVCARRTRDKQPARLSASGRAQRRLCSEGGSSLCVSSIRDQGGSEAHASVRRDLSSPPMPYGRRTLLQGRRGSAHREALDHTLKACRVCSRRALVASTSFACWNQRSACWVCGRIAPSSVPGVHPTA